MRHPAPCSPAPASPQIGTIEMKLEAAQVVRTASGRLTTPFPKASFASKGASTRSIKQVDQWLLSNALAEAEARGDDFNARMFRSVANKPQQADKDCAQEYLFGAQPEVPPRFLRNLSPAGAASAVATPSDSLHA